MSTTRRLPENVKEKQRPVFKGKDQHGRPVPTGEIRTVLVYRDTWEFPDGRTVDAHFDIPDQYRRARDIERFIEQRKQAMRDELFKRRAFPTLAVWQEEWMRLHVKVNNKGSTVKEKESMLKNHIVPFFGSMELDRRTFTTSKVLEFVSQKQQETQGPKFINNLLTCLATMLRCAVDNGKSDLQVVTRKTASGEMVGKLVIKHLRVQQSHEKPITEEEFFTFVELPQVQAAADRLAVEDSSIPWVSNLVRFFANTGVRLGEGRALHLREDIDLTRAQVVVCRNFTDGCHVDRDTPIAQALESEDTPKGVKSRVLGLNRAALSAVRAQAHLRGPYLFCHENGSPLSRNDVSNAVRKACNLAGVKELGPHGLRHTFASHFVMRGGKLVELKALLGHVDIKTTMRYAHLERESTMRAVDLLDAGQA